MRKGVRKTELVPLEGGEGEGTREIPKRREDSPLEGGKGNQHVRISRGSNRGFLRVFSLEGLGLSF